MPYNPQQLTDSAFSRLHKGLMRVLLPLAMMICLASVAWCDEPAERRRTQLLEQMRELAGKTKVACAAEGMTPVFNKTPVFRYDDQPRRFIDATMWAWTVEGRPLAFEKIEAKYHTKTDQPQWGFCFTSVSRETISAKWPEGREFRASEPGVAFRPVPDAPPVAAGNERRRRQLRELARRFSARMVIDPRTDVTQAMRLLTTPILEYADPKTDQLQGAVFGLATNGANPDLLVLLEARLVEGKARWEFAPARMTSGGIVLKYDDAVAWEVPWVNWDKAPFPTWTFFATPREPIPDETN